MKKSFAAILSMVLATTVGLSQSSVTMTIDGSNPKTVISRHIYGHFSEHLGRCIYDGFWVADSMTCS